MASSVSLPRPPATRGVAAACAPADVSGRVQARATDASHVRAARRDLAGLAPGEFARVVHLDLDEELRAWLGAVGIAVGDRLVLLRRAVFGGPVHVRTSTGGEFALNRALARSILICAESSDADGRVGDSSADDRERSA